MVRKFALSALVLLAAGGCSKTGEITEGGITALRSACPRVGIPAGTGDITVFNPPASRDATAIDVTATLTNVTSVCDEAGEQIVTTIGFDVLGSRARPGEARDVSLPYFVTVVRGGTSVIAKSVNRVTLHFDAGQVRASAKGQAVLSSTFEALVGFQLTEDQLKYNVTR